MFEKKSLSFTIAFIHVSSVLVAVAAFVVFAHSLVKGNLESALRKQLVATTATLERIVADQTASLEERVRLVQLDPALGQNLRIACEGNEGEARRRLFQRMNLLAINSGVDLVEAYGPDLKLLYRTGSEDSCGSIVDVWGLEDSLAGDNVLVFNREGPELFIRAMGPVRDEEEIVGAIAFGTKVDHAFLLGISNLVQGQLSLLVGSDLIVSGLPENPRDLPVDRNIVDQVTQMRRGLFGPPLDIDGLRFATYYFPLKVADSTVIALGTVSRAHVDEALTATTWSILGWGALVLGVGISVLFVFTRKVVRPLRGLQTAAERIGANNQYGIFLAETGSPEVMAVTRAFNEMSSRLRDTVDQLRHAKDWAELLFKFTPSAIFTVDLDHRVTSWNDKAEELTGYPAREMLGKQCSLFAEAPCLDGCGLYDDDIPKPIMGKDCAIVARNGQRMVISKNVDLLRDEHGNPIGGIETFIDVTEQRRAEQRLREAKQGAEEASHAKSEFLANISHEIRTPMSGLLGMIELLLKTEISDEQQAYLGMMQTSSDSLRELIDDVLDFSKIEAGKLSLNLARFSLRQCAESAVDIVKTKFQERGLFPEVSIDRAVPDTLVGDEGKLRQILINLLGNAIKFTESGSVRLEITRTQSPGDRVVLQFSVRDTGIGIPREKLFSIFDPFTQADGSTARKHGGTGLGLTISRSLVEMMGGRIWAHSTPGRGSVFYFTAGFTRPGDEEGGSPGEHHRAAKAIGAREDGSPSGLHILVVEDNEINQTLVTRVLHHRGHRVTVAENGRDALTALETASFDAILMDIQMPGMDGFETTARIRENAQGTGRRIPIIAMTAHAMGGDRARCLEAGMDDYISKPFAAEELYRKIDRWTRPKDEGPSPVRVPEAPHTEGNLLTAGGNPGSSDGSLQSLGSETVIDRDEALARLDGDTVMYDRLLSLFLVDGRRRLENMKEGVRRMNSEAVEREAHSLKTMAATIGARTLAQLAQVLETAGREVNREEIQARFPALDLAFKRVCDQIDPTSPEGNAP